MSAEITAQRLQLFAPDCDATLLAPLLQKAATGNEINTGRRVRHWLAQLHHESAGFTRLVENLSYSSTRLMQVWPKRFPSLPMASSCANNPKALAARVYNGRLGNTKPLDGWNYRGRGWIQLTGLTNYAAASSYSGFDLVQSPDLAADPATASLIAADFWRSHGCNQIVDRDPDEKVVASIRDEIAINEDDDLRQARRVVNGGEVGVDAVYKQLQRAGQIWNDQ